VPLWRSYEAAIGWLLAHHLPGGGLAVSHLQPEGYPEVTGYTLPTLLDCGERGPALDLARWLVAVQREDGGFHAPDGLGESYAFDVGQVLRGFLAVLDLWPDVEDATRRAAEWLLGTLDPAGVLRPLPGSAWSRRYGWRVSEDIHLYVLPPLMEAGRRLGETRYIDAAERSLRYYVQKPDLVEFRYLTHFFGYVLEALVDLGRDDLAREGLAQIIRAQRADGNVPGLPGAGWVCSPGSLQLAIVGYKLGLTTFADAVLDSTRRLQEPTGGFRGSYGPGAAYARDGELSWACKYFLDACHWRIRTSFAAQRERFRRAHDPADGRVPAVLANLGDLTGKRLLDVGCGRGQFLRLLHERYPGAELWGVDIAQELLDALPSEINRRRASMLNLPFPDGSFDAVLCVEALEHAVRIQQAVDELGRVLKPGGRLVIIDKDLSQLGALPIESWEQWFSPRDLSGLLTRQCVSVSHAPVAGVNGGQPLLVIWRATRSAQPAVLSTATHPRTRATSPWLVGYYRRSARRARARLLVQQGFASYGREDVAGAARTFVRAIQLDPTWIRNRGVVSILVRGTLSGAVIQSRRTLHAAWARSRQDGRR
jgi:malonyl-CoA O-methyltransferase